MKCRILHTSKGRLRVRVMQTRRMTFAQADYIQSRLDAVQGITRVRVYDRTGDVVLCYACSMDVVIDALAELSLDEAERAPLTHDARALDHESENQLVLAAAGRILSKVFLPAPLRLPVAAIKALKYVWLGVKSLLRGRLDVAVLDAAAITASILRGDTNTAASVMFLLKIGDILDDWTHKKTVADLARSMSLNVDNVWRRRDGADELVPVHTVAAGDLVVVRTSNVIPLDGSVVSGEAMVMQASITGEPLPVRKAAGSYVYAGTVVEEGACCIRVDKVSGAGRYDRIVSMIEESEKLKSSTEDRASHLADRLVPYSLGATALTWLITRNTTKAISILMVDFSCALKLSMPIAVLSAMREASNHKISVKGGKYMELVSAADVMVFDKTGTLTHAAPKVARVIPFGGNDADETLRLAACLEEHYPHSMARAVVDEAKRRHLNHEERHSTVEYVVAHGISSSIDGEKAVIGSYHFVFQDEGCVIPPGEEARFDAIPPEYSHLYLAVSGQLAAVICIEDPIRAEARAVVGRLHACGIGEIVMMTGDSEKAARCVAAAAGVDAWRAEVLPEDKAAFIRAAHAAGKTVVMVGDGVNDSPALSESDAGIAISDGAPIAREIADITIAADDLAVLVTLRQLSNRLMARIHHNYRFIVAFNTSLIVLGLLGVLPPATSALLHNVSTLGLGIHSTTNLLPGA